VGLGAAWEIDFFGRLKSLKDAALQRYLATAYARQAAVSVEIGLVMILSIAGIWFVCAAFTGYAMRVMRLPMRVAFAAAGLLLLMPFQASTVNAWLNVLGAVLGVALLIYEFGARSKEAA